MLTAHGLIDVGISGVNNLPVCKIRVNYTYVMDLMIILILVVFSILFIIILYNAFLITINERQKEYAILNSIGGTEGQILKMIFGEAILIGLVGIAVGGIVATIVSNIVLKNLNTILENTGYHFELIFSIKYMLLALVLIIINIYIAVLIPSVKASTMSVIQGIRGNKQIKYKRKSTILEKIFPIEGKMAIKNVKRNKSKYRVITILLVICITSYIAISTYIAYEKESSDLINEYDVDAKLIIQLNSNANYKELLRNYEQKYNKKVESIEYRNHISGGLYLVEPVETVIDSAIPLNDNNKAIGMTLIALDDKTYDKYIQKINARKGDIIVYNSYKYYIDVNEGTYSYSPILKEDIDFKLKLLCLTQISMEGKIEEYETVGSEFFNKHFVLTDERIEGFKEVNGAIYIDMETGNNLYEYIKKYMNEKKEQFEVTLGNWESGENIYVKIKCDDIIEFKNYIEDFNLKHNTKIFIDYYSLRNKEKIIYINIIQLLLKAIMIAIVTIGIVSSINIINASLCERKEDFNILYRMGASKRNIRKMLLYEGIYLFIKATIISIILSVPIIWQIIKQMKKIIEFKEFLVPIGNIATFLSILFVITIFVMIYSSKMVREE